MTRTEQIRRALELIDPYRHDRAECQSDIEEELALLAIERRRIASIKGSKGKARVANQFLGHLDKARRLVPEFYYPGWPHSQREFDEKLKKFRERAEEFKNTNKSKQPGHLHRQAAIAAIRLLSKWHDDFTKIMAAELAAILFGRSDKKARAAFRTYVRGRKPKRS